MSLWPLATGLEVLPKQGVAILHMNLKTNKGKQQQQRHQNVAILATKPQPLHDRPSSGSEHKPLILLLPATVPSDVFLSPWSKITDP